MRIMENSNSLHLFCHLPSFLACNHHCLCGGHMEYLNKGEKRMIYFPGLHLT